MVKDIEYYKRHLEITEESKRKAVDEMLKSNTLAGIEQDRAELLEAQLNDTKAIVDRQADVIVNLKLHKHCLPALDPECDHKDLVGLTLTGEDPENPMHYNGGAIGIVFCPDCKLTKLKTQINSPDVEPMNVGEQITGAIPGEADA